MLLLY